MSDWYSYLLTWVISYGPPVIGIGLLLGGIGLPIPASLLVIAAGAFSQQGVLDPILSAIVGFIAVVLGDSISYWIGKKAVRLFSPRFISHENLLYAGKKFSKFGGWMIVVTRSILSTLAIPTNLTAGSSEYPFTRFLMFDMVGEVIWILGYGSLGYEFGNSWEDISDFLMNISGFLAALVVVCILVYLLMKSMPRKIASDKN
ncbi:MAG TPA: DedA family protein [Leptolinea sp.]